MTSRLEDLEVQKAALAERKPFDDAEAKRIKERIATIDAEIAKEKPAKKVEREAQPETATRAKAPEKAVSRTSKKG